MNRLLISGFLLIVMAACAPVGHNEAGHSHDPYTCPMHPQIVQEGPGTCPICFMDLVPASQTGINGEIVLSQQQMELADIKVEQVGLDGIGSTTRLSGTLTSNQELTHMISSRVPGRIQKLKVRATGRYISKGAPLYEIYSEELLALQNEYLMMLEQNRQLGGGNDKYASFVEAARKKLLLYGMTPAQTKQLTETGMPLSEITFLAPASGVVTEVLVSEGQYVSEGSPLYKLEGLNPLWVEAELYPREAAMVKQGDQVQIIVNGFGNEPVTGNVIFMNPEYRTGTQIITFRAALPNPDGNFIPGTQASIFLANGNQEALTLPSNAVIRSEDGAHAWVKTGEGTFEPRIVKTGMETFSSVEILEGLRKGDSVVVSGAYLLYSELVLKAGMKM